MLAVAVCASLGMTLAEHKGLADFIFQAFVVLMLELVVRQALVEWRRGSAARRNAAELATQSPSEAALRAVRHERARLSAEISAGLRVLLTDVERAAREATLAVDPQLHVAAIRRRAQEGISELKRQLGLLRDPSDEPGGPTSVPPGGTASMNRDVMLAVAVTAIAAVECVLYPRQEGEPFSVATILLTMALAATVVGRRTMPALAATACAGLYLAGLAWSVKVEGGFWLFVTLGGLLWTLAGATSQRSAAFSSAALLFGSAAVSTSVLDRDNAGILMVIMAVAFAGGLATARARARAYRAAAEEAVHKDVLEQAVKGAVVAERHGFAREIHDIVSHAVGVIAMQAAAAEVSWPHDAARVNDCLATIAETARKALAELTLVEPAAPVASRSYSDVVELVERMRASGVTVGLTSNLDRSDPLDHSLYRVVQEALTNAVRHAPGSSVIVRVERLGDEIMARVTDSGSQATSTDHRGYGLIGLEERLAFAGGTLSAGTSPDGRGFRVEARLPGRMGASA